MGICERVSFKAKFPLSKRFNNDFLTERSVFPSFSVFCDFQSLHSRYVSLAGSLRTGSMRLFVTCHVDTRRYFLVALTKSASRAKRVTRESTVRKSAPRDARRTIRKRGKGRNSPKFCTNPAECAGCKHSNRGRRGSLNHPPADKPLLPRPPIKRKGGFA